ncbi:MAG: peptidase M3, partial [Nitratireductor sp.]|nr:peptidase M3 [Nitratireductor sp.]
MTNTDSKGAAPFFDWKGVHGLPVFSNLDDDAFRPAFEVAMAEHNREIEAIAGNHDTPDFANTIDALELCGLKLSRVSALFWNRAGADTNETIRSLEREMAPLLSRHYSAIARNKALFGRIDDLWQRR